MFRRLRPTPRVNALSQGKQEPTEVLVKIQRLRIAAPLGLSGLLALGGPSRARVTTAARETAAADSTPPGVLVDIGGQRLHVYCTGHGSPTVLLESGSGDFSVIWALVQPGIASFTRVCSYDRGGYAWSDPGAQPRTYWQLVLELHTAAERLHLPPPYVLVGQSYGGLLVRGFADHYRRDVAGMVLVNAVHEDQRIVINNQPTRIRDWANGRPCPSPHIALDTTLLRTLRDSASRGVEALDSELERLPPNARSVWLWAAARPVYRASSAAEMNWSPEELARMHEDRLSDRVSLGDLPLVVLARSAGDYPDGMQISADSLEHERLALQADLARLSRKGRLVVARHAGHNIHLDDPALVITSVRQVVDTVRAEWRR